MYIGLNSLGLNTAPFAASPVASLFQNGEPGAMFIAQKPSSLYARRNRFLYSEDITNATWAKSNGGTVTSGIDDPLGTTRAQRWVAGATAGAGLQQAYTNGGTTAVTISGWFRDPTQTGSNTRLFNLNPNLDSGGVFTVGNTWQYLSYTLTGLTPGQSLQARIDRTISNGVTIDVFALQVEYGSTASTYQKVTDWTTEYLAAVGPQISQYTLSDGSVPVLNLDDPVGLHLDTRPIYYGPTLVTNGTFNTDVTNWSAAGGTGDITFAWSAGTMAVTRGAGAIAGRPEQSFPVRNGATYQLQMSVTTNNLAVQVGTSSGSGDMMAVQSISAGTTRTLTFTANANTAYLNFWPFNPSQTVNVDNIIVKEVLAPNQAGTPKRSVEQITNGDFGSGTGWTLNSATISGGTLNIGAAAGGVALATNNAIPAGVWCEVTYTIVSITGNISAGPTLTNPGTQRTAPGTYREIIFTTASGNAGVFARGAGVTSAVVDNLSVKIIYGNHRSQSTAGARGILSARYNKCQNRNANPTDLTNVQFTNATNSLATLTVVNDAAALTAAGLSNICTLGNVYKLDNTSGNSPAYAFPGNQGVAGNANNHQLFIWARMTGTANSVAMGLSVNGNGNAFINSAGYTQYKSTGVAAAGSGIQISANPGSVVYFILNDLREACYSYLPTPQIVWDATTGYDDTGFPARIKYSGAQGYATAAVDFSGSTAMQGIVGLAKLSDAAQATVFGLSNITAAGGYELFGPSGPSGNNFAVGSNGGTTFNSATAAGWTSPIPAIVTGLTDTSGVGAWQVRMNGQVGGSTTGTSTTGTGTMANSALSYGGRGVTTSAVGSLPFTGDEFVSIVRGGSAPVTGTTYTIEQWVGRQMGANI